MDEQALLVLRMFGYVLNAAIFAATVIKFRHHAPVLLAWLVWFGVVIVAVWYQLNGAAREYTLLINYGVMALLYVNAMAGAFVFLRHEPKRKDEQDK